MKIYLVRHGQTDWNLQCRIQGRSDIPLNETGKKQAEELKKNIAELEFDVCYASPLIRAAETAKIAVDEKCEIVYDERLMERRFGDFEGKVAKDCKWSNIIKGDLYDRRTNISEGGMETVKELLARSRGFLDWLKTKYPDDAKILIVAHGALLKTLHYNIVGYDDDTDFYDFFLENGEVVEYNIKK